MDEFFDQFFPTEFLIEYLENGPEENMDRFQTYVVYRFLTFAAKENPAVITELRDTLECPLSMDNLSDIYRFLDQDFYFSPSFSENSFDPVLLCYAIAIIDDKSGFGLAILNRIFKEACPEISSMDFSNVDVDLELLLQTEVQFYAALAICSIHYSTPADAAVLMKHILSYAAAYELRNNLYDYHLDEDKTITLTNWKENLKWHYVQYTNVYNLALSSFVAACYSRKLLQKQFEENLRELNY